VQLKKALYGTLQAALLFWQLLKSSLVKLGFKINLYNHCVPNKIINGKQCTILWHVDDLKISHIDKNVVEDILKSQEKKFGQEGPFVTTSGKVLEYLGMTLDYSKKGKVQLSIFNYIKKIIEEAPEDMTGRKKTPMSGHLFTINENCEKLPEKTVQCGHHMVAKLLYLCWHTRQDIQMAMAFLCTHVQNPDNNDYKKLSRIIQYLRGTQELTLTIKQS